VGDNDSVVSACHGENREFPTARCALGGVTVVKADAVAVKSKREIVFCIIIFSICPYLFISIFEL